MPADPAADDDALPELPVEDASARVVVARVLGSTGARSAVVVGGAADSAGAWARACRERGVPEVVTVGANAVLSDDGPDNAVDDAPDGGAERAVEHVDADPAEPLDLGGRYFGLAICVDLAHALAPDRAAGLVADLTAVAPVVLFAAAVPGQGHDPGREDDASEHENEDDGVRADPEPRNEQWPEHWVGLFEAEGWSCRDAIRPWVRTNDDVAWWHRQSLFLAVAPSVERAYSSFPLLGAERPRQPVDYLVRPDGGAMTPPRPAPVPEAVPAEPAADDIPPPPPPRPRVPGAPDGNGTTPAHEDGTIAATDAPEPPVTSDDADATGTGDASTDGTDEELMFPEPPGWATLRRVAGRARRRSGR
jgi:hypothetical protein